MDKIFTLLNKLNLKTSKLYYINNYYNYKFT